MLNFCLGNPLGERESVFCNECRFICEVDEDLAAGLGVIMFVGA
jgi:hypothetical protein